MTKKKVPVSQEEFEAELQSVVPQKAKFNPDTPLIGIMKIDKGFAIIKVMVDSKTMVAGEAEILHTSESKWEANESFKINVVKERIM